MNGRTREYRLVPPLKKNITINNLPHKNVKDTSSVSSNSKNL